MYGDRALPARRETRRSARCDGRGDGAGIVAFAHLGVAADETLSRLSWLMGAGPLGVRVLMASSGQIGCRCCLGPPPLFVGVDAEDESLAPAVSAALQGLPAGDALAVDGATAALMQSVVLVGDQTCRVTGTVKVTGEADELVLLHLSDLSRGLVSSQGSSESQLVTTAVFRQASPGEESESRKAFEACVARIGWQLVSTKPRSVPVSAGDPRADVLPRSAGSSRDMPVMAPDLVHV